MQQAQLLDYNESENEKAFRYPVLRTTYVRETGAIRQDSVARALNEIFPFADLKCGHVNANGTDITLIYNGKTYRFEVINENVTSYIDTKKACGIYRNLEAADVSVFICNCGNFGSEDAKEILSDIPTLKVGWQELPSEYYPYYKKRDKVYRRRKSSKRSFRKLKEQLLKFLHKINFPLLMYIQYAITNRINIIITLTRLFRARIIRFASKIVCSILKTRLKSSLIDFVASVKSGLSEFAKYIQMKTQSASRSASRKIRKVEIYYRMCLGFLSSSSKFYASFVFLSYPNSFLRT
jgi:hypothetical protein